MPQQINEILLAVGNDMILLICSLLGFLAHSFNKLAGLAKDARAAKVPFDWKKDYVVKNSWSLLLSLIAPVIFYFLFAEIAAKLTWMQGFVRVSFFTVGAMGSYFIQSWFGVTRKITRKVISEKTGELEDIKSEDSTDH